MSEMQKLESRSSDTKKNQCEHANKLSCPACDGQFCTSCLGSHVGTHMRQTQTLL